MTERPPQKQWQWNHGTALAAVDSMTRVAKNAGYLLGWYGSTTTGWGRDLDLLAVPWRPDADPRDLVRRLHMELLLSHVGPIYYGAMGTMTFSLVTPEGRPVDLQVREVPQHYREMVQLSARYPLTEPL